MLLRFPQCIRSHMLRTRQMQPHSSIFCWKLVLNPCTESFRILIPGAGFLNPSFRFKYTVCSAVINQSCPLQGSWECCSQAALGSCLPQMTILTYFVFAREKFHHESANQTGREFCINRQMIYFLNKNGALVKWVEIEGKLLLSCWVNEVQYSQKW